MTSSQDSFMGSAPGGDPERASDDDELFGGAAPVVEPARAVGRRGRPRTPPTSGTFHGWIVADGEPGPSSASSTDVFVPGALRSVVSLASFRWIYEPSAVAAAPTVAGGPGAGVGREGPSVAGAVGYYIDELFPVEPAVALPDSLDLSSPIACYRMAMLCDGATMKEDPSWIVATFLDWSEVPWEHSHVMSSRAFARLLTLQLPQAYDTVLVGRQVQWDSFVPGHPPRSSVNRWRRDSGLFRRAARAVSHVLHGQTPVPTANTLLRLPGKRSIVHVDGHDDAHYPEHSWMRRKFEPMKLVNAVSFASKLRQVAEFTDALEDVDC